MPRLSRPPAAPLVLLLLACGQRIVPAAAPVPAPPDAPIETRLFLIGDAGAPARRGEPVLAALGTQLDSQPSTSLVLFLGDNVYPRGLPDSAAPDFAEAARRLDTQVDLLVSRGVRGIFLPGNHDWDRFGPDGWNAIRRQGDRIRARGAGLVRLEPREGCPGPVTVDQGTRLRLVLLDTQWWLHGGPRPHDASSGCAAFTETAVRDSLAAALSAAGDRVVVVAGHHPLATGGEHGGFFDWKDHLFPLRNVKRWLWIPLPVLGSAYPLSRNLGVSAQDLSSGRYRRLRDALAGAFGPRPPLVYAAGHEHGLQVVEGGAARFQLVSGAGIYQHESPLRGIPGSTLALQEAGFMRLDLLCDGRVRLAVFTVNRAGAAREIHSRWLAPEAKGVDATCH